MSRDAGFTIRPVMVVNKGASFGPRVATVTFEKRWWRGPRYELSVSADIDGERYQDESGVRRRAGRAAVPVARRAAAAFAGAEYVPEVVAGKQPPWATAIWSYREEFESFLRVVRASADFRWHGSFDASVAAPEEITERIVRDLRALATWLHVAIDDPANRAIFGGS